MTSLLAVTRSQSRGGSRISGQGVKICKGWFDSFISTDYLFILPDISKILLENEISVSQKGPPHCADKTLV